MPRHSFTIDNSLSWISDNNKKIRPSIILKTISLLLHKCGLNVMSVITILLYKQKNIRKKGEEHDMDINRCYTCCITMNVKQNVKL